MSAICLIYESGTLRGSACLRSAPSIQSEGSQDRADAVMADLVALGVSRDRLEAQGYGDQFPVADNSTAEGRAKNPRVSMRVTQK